MLFPKVFIKIEGISIMQLQTCNINEHERFLSNLQKQVQKWACVGYFEIIGTSTMGKGRSVPMAY